MSQLKKRSPASRRSLYKLGMSLTIGTRDGHLTICYLAWFALSPQCGIIPLSSIDGARVAAGISGLCQALDGRWRNVSSSPMLRRCSTMYIDPNGLRGASCMIKLRRNCTLVLYLQFSTSYCVVMLVNLPAVTNRPSSPFQEL